MALKAKKPKVYLNTGVAHRRNKLDKNDPLKKPLPEECPATKRAKSAFNGFRTDWKD